MAIRDLPDQYDPRIGRYGNFDQPPILDPDVHQGFYSNEKIKKGSQKS